MAEKIIFVPGIGGSQLRYANQDHLIRGFVGVEKAWFRLPGFLLGDVGALGLDATGLQPLPGRGRALLPYNLLDWFYVPFCDHLRGAGWDVVAYAHDWREAIQWNVEGLYNLLKKVSITGVYPTVRRAVKFVCHSRGCLVVAALVEKLRSTGELSLIDRVIAMGGPFRGSWLPVPWLARDAWGLEGALGLFSIGHMAIKVKYIRPAVYDVVRTFPALYELLPDPIFAAANGDGSVAQLYNPDFWSGKELIAAPQWLQRAKDRWTAYVQPFEDVKAYCIAGTGFMTLCGPLSADTFPAASSVLTNKQGDETVLVSSARLPGIPGTTVVESHCGMLDSTNIRVHVNNLLNLAPGDFPT